MVNDIGTTNALIVVFIVGLAVVFFIAFVYLRTQTGNTAPNAIMGQFISQLGRLATSIDTLTSQQFELNKQLIGEANKGIEQRDKLIDVLNANQTVLVAMDGNLTIMGKGLETSRNQTDTYYSQLHQRLIDIVAADTIAKGEIDLMRRFDEKLNADIEEIKQKLNGIETLLKESALSNASDRKTVTEALEGLKQEVAQLAASINDTGEHPAVDVPPETKIEPPQE